MVTTWWTPNVAVTILALEVSKLIVHVALEHTLIMSQDFARTLFQQTANVSFYKFLSTPTIYLKIPYTTL